MKRKGVRFIKTAAASTAICGMLLPCTAHEDHSEAMLRLQQLAAEGNATALFINGCRYAREGDRKQAEEMLRRAAELSHPGAGAIYGMWSMTEHNYKPALLYLTQEALNNNPHALFCLGYLYYRGWGVPRNPNEAYRLLAQAAELGQPQACTVLAIMHLRGEGCEADADEAARLLEVAMAAPADKAALAEEDEEEPQEAADEAAAPDNDEPDADDEADSDDEPDADDEEDEDEDDDSYDEDDYDLSELGISSPEYVLGLMQLRGVGAPEAPESAFPLIVKGLLDGEGDGTAKHIVATLYRRGIGTDPAENHADEWDASVAPEDREAIDTRLGAYLQATTAEEKLAALVELLPGAAQQDMVPEKRQLIERIMALPSYTIHESTRTQFREQLDDGEYKRQDGKHYLTIGGDGAFGNRIFISDDEGALYVVSEDWEEGHYDVLRYDALQNTLIRLFSLKKEQLSE